MKIGKILASRPGSYRLDPADAESRPPQPVRTQWPPLCPCCQTRLAFIRPGHGRSLFACPACNARLSIWKRPARDEEFETPGFILAMLADDRQA